jgi:natural resistance-associated macrophage protein
MYNLPLVLMFHPHSGAIRHAPDDNVLRSQPGVRADANPALLCCAGVILTAGLSFILLFIERLGVRHLEACFAFLISVMALSFGAMFASADIPYRKVSW